MILLGLLLILVGWFTIRPLVWIGAVLCVIGLVLFIGHVGAYGTWPYVPATQ